MSTAGVSGLLWKARTLAVPPPAEAGTAKARTRAAARMAPTRTRSLATTYDLLQRGAGYDPYFGPAPCPVAGGREGAGLLQAVAVAHGLVAGVDLAQAGVAEAAVDLVQVLADELLLGLGDAAAVGLAGVLEGGVVDLAAARAARARGRPAARARTGGAGAAAVLGDEGVLDRRLHHARAGQQVEVIQADHHPLALAGAGGDPLHGDEAARALELLDLLGEDLEGHRQVGVLGVLVDHEPTKRLLVGLLARNVRHMDDLDCHQGGFLLDAKRIAGA